MSGDVKIRRETILTELATGRGRSIRLRLVEYERGGVRFDIRQFFVDDAGQTLPTSKGCGLKVEHIPALRQALDQFEREARTT